MPQIRILLADDHDLILEGLCSLIREEPGLEVVASAQDGREALRLAKKERPHLVVMDIAMPGLNGIDATRHIAEELPGTKILCLSMHKERSMVTAMFRAGASGYIVKNSAGRELIGAIRCITEGKTYISPSIAGDIVDTLLNGTHEDSQNPFKELTQREREVLQLLAEGLHTKEIASELDISHKTVAVHRLKVMEKLDCQSVADLTRYAIRHGLVEA